jgi:hypothetical protein
MIAAVQVHPPLADFNHIGFKMVPFRQETFRLRSVWHHFLWIGDISYRNGSDGPIKTRPD